MDKDRNQGQLLDDRAIMSRVFFRTTYQEDIFYHKNKTNIYLFLLIIYI